MSKKLETALYIWGFILITAVVAAFIYTMLFPTQLVLGCYE